MADFNREVLNEMRELPRDSEDLGELTRKATEAFRKLTPTLNAYVRALTGDHGISVEMHSQINGATDGQKVYMRPPLALGRDVKHDRSLCDKRAPRTLEQRCPACARLEGILIVLYHEIAHIAYGTFLQASAYEKERFLGEVLRLNTSAFAKAAKSRIDAAPYEMRRSWQAMCNLVDERFGLLFNAVEDVRVNVQMFKARKGTHDMMTAKALALFEDGVEQRDPLTGQTVVILWRDYPLDAQAAVGIMARAMGIQGAYFHDKIEQMLEDSEIKRLILRIRQLRSAEGAVRISFNLLVRLRELGFMLPPEEREEPKDPDQGEDEENNETSTDSEDAGESEGSGEDGGDASDSGEHGSESGSEPQDTPGVPDGSEAEPDDADGEPQEGSPSEEEGNESESDSPAGTDKSDDPELGGSESGDSGVPDPGDGESGSDVDDDQAADAAGDSDDGGASEDSGSPGDGGGPSARASRDAQVDANQDDDPSGYTGIQADGTSDGAGQDPQQRGNMESQDSEGELSDDAESRDSDREGTGERPDGTEAGDLSSGSASDSTSLHPGGGEADWDDAQSSKDGTGQGGAGDAIGDSTGEASESEEAQEAEVIDPGSHQGAGVRVIDQEGTQEESSASDPEYGDIEDIKSVLIKLGDHEVPDSVTSHGHNETRVKEALDRAIIQSVFFERPSHKIHGVTFAEHDTNRGWSTGRHQRGSSHSISYGISGDFTPPRAVLGPALLRMRRVFSDNRLAAREGFKTSGRVDTRALGRRAWQKDDRLFSKKTRPGAKDYFVLIGIDVSFSTAGQDLVIAKKAAMAQAELCHRTGVDFAVYAHTGGHVKGGFDLILHVVKERKQLWDEAAILRLADLAPHSANIDGHTLEQYRKVCDEVPRATQCIIMYYTDGAMPAENYTEELEILVREIANCKKNDYQLMGVGIRTDSPTRHGLDTVRLDSVDDVDKVVAHLEKKMIGKREVRR